MIKGRDEPLAAAQAASDLDPCMLYHVLGGPGILRDTLSIIFYPSEILISPHMRYTPFILVNDRLICL